MSAEIATENVGLFAKAPRISEPSQLDGLLREAEVYSYISQSSEQMPWLPTLVHFDHYSSTLVTTLFRNANRIFDIRRTDERRFLARMIDAIQGLDIAHRTLSRLHVNRGNYQRSTIPWIFKRDTPLFQRLSSCRCGSIATDFLNSRRCMMFILQTGSLYRTCAVTHQDIKWSNILVRTEDERFCIVDWELSAWGDPVWDFSGMIHQFIIDKLFSLNANANSPLFAIVFEQIIAVISRDWTLRNPRELLMKFTVARSIQAMIEVVLAGDGDTKKLSIAFQRLETIMIDVSR